MIRWIVLLFFAIVYLPGFPQEKAGYFANKKHWKQVKKQIPQYKKVFKNPDKYRFEVIYGQVTTDKQGNKKVTYYQTGSPDVYYYPASLVKFPMAVKLLEWLSYEGSSDLMSMQIQTVNDSACGFSIGDYKRHFYGKTLVNTDPYDAGYTFHAEISDQVRDSIENLKDSIPAGSVMRLTSEPMPFSVHDLLWEMLVYSDNAHYNRLFEAVAPRNSNLDKLFYIPRPFIPCSGSYTSAGADFYLHGEKWKSLPGGMVQKKYDAKMKKEKVGIAQMVTVNDSGLTDTLRNGRDFSAHNHVSLYPITELMQEIIYPGSTSLSLSLSSANRKWLRKFLYLNPIDKEIATRPEYLTADTTDTNFLFPDKNADTYIKNARFYNIIGQAYGFSSDVLYYCNPLTNTEFFLSARIYTNEDEVLNDDRYEYETIAIPLMRQLFTTILEMEKKRGINSNGSLSFPEQP